jgi:hypothetical protein
MKTGVSLHALGLAAALAVANVAALGGVANAATIESGEHIHAVLSSQDINTKNAQVGQTFTMRVVPPFPNDDQALANATIDGHVEDVQSAGQGRKAVLTLAIDRITYPNGTASGIHAYVSAVDETKDNTTTRKALGAGVGAAVGSQTIGRLLGGALGGVVGIAGGAAAGYAYANNNKPNMNVAHRSPITLTLTRPLYISRRQASE